MEEQNSGRNRWLHIRLTKEELDFIDKNFKASVCRKRSDFVRRNLLRKPIVMKYRNESLDKLLQELIQLRTQLNFMGNNFNQSVKKLHTLFEISDFRIWILSFESDRNRYFSLIEEIKKSIENLAQKWLQS
ncbi:plasmid mobilization protein [Flavobacterium quisquiliarum]|uniref:Plasmid mobilization relaxosome protein MobC n=1 Tax=Flavobacterium quisquiliarum TaxID=1834436 RepID=A0ABV8W5L6_9FLAO|nr:plasmid mobilization relaxosome protein MobC [Flavobacterium quisquiliarum]MBW1654964.1 plasmid mobilization relaxosome protein MobC [Flavobacterium quisquiliarum]MBW1655910.1 plasmid mobilization relaxosome protein MobC [Flavobacterium quisquiliarum]MBW1655973.1 plasmid mobilization relaxosome protein MobC [Flavobacterium quisquiliarum]MBW1656175.1 plasmid mobilization relaxosome protein MobC [Flavobacterium quisquiliarum]